MILELFSFPRHAIVKAIRLIRGPERPRIPNLLGDREIEWSWIAAMMPSGPGEALEFGPGESSLGLISFQKGFTVTAVDLEPVYWRSYVQPRFRFIREDILKLQLPHGYFDLVINCSAVEHVGLSGRYGIKEDRPNGDLDAMKVLWKLMKPGGVMLLTIPIGRDAVFVPMCRVYGKERLPLLLDGYTVEDEAYWIKNGQNRWMVAEKKTALDFKASAGAVSYLQNIYALGCFVLRKLSGESRGSDDTLQKSHRKVC